MYISVNPGYFDLIPYNLEEYRSTSKFEQIQGMTVNTAFEKQGYTYAYAQSKPL